MFRAVIAFALLVAVAAFGPAGRVSTRSAMKMELYDNAKGIVGSDIEFPEFDPLGFTKGATPEQLTWYRQAELKHGRVAMLAALGQIVQYYHHPVFPEAINGDKPFAAAATVFADRPLAVAQILLAIFAVEALGQFNQVKDGQEPGDLDFVSGRPGPYLPLSPLPLLSLLSLLSSLDSLRSLIFVLRSLLPRSL